MGFDKATLFEFVFGLLIPAAVVLYFIFSKKRKSIAYDAITYGFGAFLGSIVAVFILMTILTAAFGASLTFDDEDSGMVIMGALFCAVIVLLFFVCETLKIMTIRKFLAQEEKTKLSGVGFSAGVILAQNVVMFVALNVMSKDEMSVSFALYSGGIICVTGIMYLVLSLAGETILAGGGSMGPVYALASVYYLFWVSAIVFARSTVLIYISSALFFILAFVLSGVFLFRSKKGGAQS